LQRAPLVQALVGREEAQRRKLAALQRALADAEHAEELRLAGEGLLANLHTVEPAQTSLTYQGREIALDPALTPLENAQRYFESYTRARDAARVVPAVVEETELELRYLAEMRAQIELAEDAATLEQLRRELVERGLLAPSRGETKRGRTTPPRGGYTRLQCAGAEMLVGTSALGNERVTFELSSPDDLWFHARGVAGSHIIVRTGGQAPSMEAIEAAARLAAEHSAARTEAVALVDWTARKHVRKIRNAPPGLVTYRNEQTLRMRLQGE
jgi:predicted ribosome quality control (RQC) complex YloA/Tae2 family protein